MGHRLELEIVFGLEDDDSVNQFQRERAYIIGELLSVIQGPPASRQQHRPRSSLETEAIDCLGFESLGGRPPLGCFALSFSISAAYFMDNTDRLRSDDAPWLEFR